MTRGASPIDRKKFGPGSCHYLLSVANRLLEHGLKNYVRFIGCGQSSDIYALMAHGTSSHKVQGQLKFKLLLLHTLGLPVYHIIVSLLFRNNNFKPFDQI